MHHLQLAAVLAEPMFIECSRDTLGPFAGVNEFTQGLGFRIRGPKKLSRIIENQLEDNMENQMETWCT